MEKVKSTVESSIDPNMINPSNELVPVSVGMVSDNEQILINSGVDDISKLISPKLLDKIIDLDDDIIINYDKDLNRPNFNEGFITLGKYDIDDKKMTYNSNGICHEYGHAIEYMIPEISNLCKDFLQFVLIYIMQIA